MMFIGRTGYGWYAIWIWLSPSNPDFDADRDDHAVRDIIRHVACRPPPRSVVHLKRRLKSPFQRFDSRVLRIEVSTILPAVL